MIWPEVTWCPDCSCHTDTTDGRTYEKVYTGWNDKTMVTTILTVTSDDVNLYGLPRYKVALQWANNIRQYVNGWNCTKSPDSPNPPTLYGYGFILQLKVPTGNASSSGTASGTRYGTGETLPNFTMRNGNIFHTNDLTIAVPSSLSTLDDKWVRIGYGGKSVVCRATDRSGGPIDLSAGGVAAFLGFPGSGTVSYGPP